MINTPDFDFEIYHNTPIGIDFELHDINDKPLNFEGYIATIKFTPIGVSRRIADVAPPIQLPISITEPYNEGRLQLLLTGADTSSEIFKYGRYQYQIQAQLVNGDINNVYVLVAGSVTVHKLI